MLRRISLSLALGLAASCAVAQTAPSPADVGISKGTPDVFKLKGHDNAWTPFGSIDPTTHVYVPGTNGSIAPNDCVKWGPGLTSAGAACNSVTGGAHPANQLTIYTSHAGLVANVTTPTEAWTVLQQGFYAPGDGGGATYQWNLTSTCTADGINCVLPIGQSSGTPGRYLLQLSGTLDVRQVGMRSGGADNSSLLAPLMAALGPSGFNNGGAEVVFPGDINKPFTAYYFSNSFVISRVARFRCGNGQNGSGVELVFAAGVQGVIQEDAHYTSDGQYGGGTVDGCNIVSLGFAGGYIQPGASTITGLIPFQDPGGLLPVTTWHVGDGIIATPGGAGYLTNLNDTIPAVHPGAYLSAVSGSTLTLASGYTGSANLNAGDNGLALYQFPAALKYTVQTTAGSSTAIVTAGPRPLASGEVIWSDAFPIGSMVFTADGNTFPQTIHMATFSDAGSNQNATVTHSSGSPGQMWVVPAGLKRGVQANASHNFITQWPVGLEMACSSATGAYLNCTGSHDDGNSYFYDLVGRWTGGNNTSASSSINEEGGKNYWADVLEGGTLGSVYVNLNSNSWEHGTSAYSIMGNCANLNESELIGGYIIGSTPGCADQVKIFPPTNGGPWFAVGNQAQEAIAPAGIPAMFKGSFAGSWAFLKNGINGDPCVGMHMVGYILAVSYNGCANAGTMGVSWNATAKAWAWAYQITDISLWQFGEDYKGYLPADKAGGINAPVLELGNSGENWTGQERAFDAGHTPPPGARLQGDTRFNQAPVPGGYSEWTNTKIGQTTLAAAVTAGSTTSVAVASCPAGLPAGIWVVAQSNINAHPIELDQALGTLASCVGTTLTLNAASTYNSINGATIQFLQWRPAGHIANDVAGTSWPVATAVNIASLVACSATTVGFGVVNNGVAVGTGGYGTAVSATGSSTRPVFCDGANWTYH